MSDTKATGPIAIISAAMDGASADEWHVLCVLAGRLKRGRDSYGALDIASDRRNWRKERAEEHADVLVYAAIEEVARHL